MIEGNPYKVIIKKCRRRFKADAVGTAPIETVNLKTGEVRTATQLIGMHKFYDTTDFIKFYQPSVLIGLSREAVAVFSYITSRLQFGGYVCIDYADCISYTSYTSRQSIYRGLRELEKLDIIRPRSRHEWWVNPNIIYRGQRDEFEI